jgi:hypothetical protein
MTLDRQIIVVGDGAFSRPRRPRSSDLPSDDGDVAAGRAGAMWGAIRRLRGATSGPDER